jgi:hypothetical protein
MPAQFANDSKFDYLIYLCCHNSQKHLMEFIVIPTSSRSEKLFFLDLLHKMQKKSSTLSAAEMEDYALMDAMKEAETSGKGSLQKVKKHLSKISSGK